ncbi:hypothetical protein ES705_16417 [subsurface metagenome]
MCDCLEKVEAECRKHTGDWKGVIDWIARPLLITFPAFPRMRFIYHKKGIKREYEKSVIPTFCPFCGKEY